jgi:succinyl-CoA synthetase beta subunit
MSSASAAEAEDMCRKFLGKPFSTYQSAGESKTVRSMLITEDIPIGSEYYLGIVLDRQKGKPVVLASREGGVDIEEVARKNPEAILKTHFEPDRGLARDDFEKSLRRDFDAGVAAQIAETAAKIARLFVEKDASIVEINPLVLSKDGRVMALDAKIVFDDNALYRHEDVRAMKDPEEDDLREQKAKEFGLSYVSMSGNVGCLVNGAGLAMATMDMIKLAGGEPANFLDVGGSATADQVREGFKIILQDERVHAILVNIFGGIMKCDVIAEGVIQASREIQPDVPLIVRLQGTRVKEGRELLKNSGLRIVSCETIQEAAETAVREAEAHRRTHVDTRR